MLLLVISSIATTAEVKNVRSILYEGDSLMSYLDLRVAVICMVDFLGDERPERVRTTPSELSSSSSAAEDRLARRLLSVERRPLVLGLSSRKRSRSDGSLAPCLRT